MHSPPHHPPSATDFLSSQAGHSTDSQDVEAHKDTHGPSGSAHQHVINDSVTGWPWCQSCRPLVQILLTSIGGQGPPSAATPWALPSPFPEYVCVPALVHRSQLALFAPGPAHPLPPPHQQPETGSAVRATSTGGRQRKPRGVKIACTNCRLANKKCDEGRPCERCKKNGLKESCISAERKQRRSRAARQTATAAVAVTVSTAQDSLEHSTIPEDNSTTTVHIAAAASYVDDTQESADIASHSSPSGSSVTDSDNQPNASAPPADYAIHTNFWTSIQPFHTANSDAQFSNWAFNDQDHTSFFGHAMSPTGSSDYHGLSPTGLERSSAFPTAGQHF